MNLNQLRFAQSVADTRSFSRAAEHCHVTQPTLSNGIAQLEEELGARLFDRTTRSVRTTRFGEHILPLIGGVLDDLQELRAAARGWHEPEHQLVRIGLSPVIDMPLLADILEPYRREHPETEIFFKECFLDDMEQRLDQAQVDIAILPRRERRLGRETLPLYAESLYYLPRDGAPAVGSPDGVSLGEAARETLILTINGCGLADTIRDMFGAVGHRPREYPGQAVSYKVVEDWASLGIGGGILPRSKISGTADRGKPLLLDGGEPARILCDLTWNANQSLSRPVRELIDYLASTGQRIAEGRAA